MYRALPQLLSCAERTLLVSLLNESAYIDFSVLVSLEFRKTSLQFLHSATTLLLSGRGGMYARNKHMCLLSYDQFDNCFT